MARSHSYTWVVRDDGTKIPLPKLLIDQGDTSWRDRALCAEVDPELWFPEKGESPARAKDICARCPVTEECAQTALANNERFGIWGGLSERDRRELRDKRRPGRPRRPAYEEAA